MRHHMGGADAQCRDSPWPQPSRPFLNVPASPCCLCHPSPCCSPISRVFKVVWAAWCAPKQAAATDGTEPLLLSRAGSAGLDSSLPAGINGSGGLHSGLNGSSAAAAMGGTGGVGGGMGRRTQSLQWLNAAAEARVAGGRQGQGWIERLWRNGV